MHAQKIIVIHPGSQKLRIGRASDLNPITILHAIGRRRRHEAETLSQLQYHDSLLPPLQTAPDVLKEFEGNRLQLSHAIQSHVPQYQERGAKRLRIATPPQQIATFNKRVEPEELPLENHDKCEHLDGHGKKENARKEESEAKENIFDEDILKLTSNELKNYNVHFPMKRGELNVHQNVGGSLTSVISDMECIWLYAIQKLMSISRISLEQYGAVLVVSDVYNRSILKELVHLILQRLHFRACFLIQENVAATFGAGLGYACVVDVGDQKCSVSCVEDGISHPDTRVRLGYGSSDVTQVFWTLLKKCCFPYKECDVAKDYADAALIQRLKEQNCHLNLDISGAQERTFEVCKSVKHLLYTFQLGDECVVAPFSLFHTELFNITGKERIVRLQYRSSQQSDPEDCFDAEYLRETGRVRNGRGDQLLEGTMPITGDTADDDLVVVDNFDMEDRSANMRNSDKDEQLYYSTTGQIVPLDLAIVRSIERCPSEDMKRKMYGCILLVGGGSKLTGFAKWLEQKIILQQSTNASNMRPSEPLVYEVNVIVKEMNAAMIAWKGAAIMSCLESAPELWIFSPEWEKYGLRILREKSIFMW